jgi:UDP-2,3-diacylglucosamine hydrolase
VSLDGGAPIGLIAGNGVLPGLFAHAARAQGRRVVALAHRGETDASLVDRVDALEWVRVGQLDRIVRLLNLHHVREVVLAGGIHRVRALTEARPDLGALRVISRLRSFRDDALLRGVADYLESKGIRVIAPTDFAPEMLAPEGALVGGEPDAAARRDIALGIEVAIQLGRADVGQTVVVKNGHVLALEAIEGTDETIRRGGRLGGPGAVVVKVAKPEQDARFDLPAVGEGTIHTMEEAGARLLAVEAGRTLLLEAPRLWRVAEKSGIAVFGARVSRSRLG